MEMVAPTAKLRHGELFVMPQVACGSTKPEATGRVRSPFGRGTGVERVLIIGGDRSKPAAPLDSSLAVIRSGVFQRVAIVRMAVAGPHISPKGLDKDFRNLATVLPDCAESWCSPEVMNRATVEAVVQYAERIEVWPECYK